MTSIDIFNWHKKIGETLSKELVHYRKLSNNFIKNMSEEEKDVILQYQGNKYRFLKKVLMGPDNQHNNSKNESIEMYELVDWAFYKNNENDQININSIGIGMIPWLKANAELNIQNFIKVFDSLFLKAPKLTKDTILYKGMKDFYFNEINVGDIINIPYLMSTSINPSVARRFAYKYPNAIEFPILNKQKTEEKKNKEKTQKKSVNKNKNKNKKEKEKDKGKDEDEDGDQTKQNNSNDLLSLEKIQNGHVIDKGLIFVIKTPKNTPFVLMESVSKFVWEFEILLKRSYKLKITGKKITQDLLSTDYIIWDKEEIIKNEDNQGPKNCQTKNKFKWDEIGIVYADLIEHDHDKEKTEKKESNKKMKNKCNDILPINEIKIPNYDIIIKNDFI